MAQNPPFVFGAGGGSVPVPDVLPQHVNGRPVHTQGHVNQPPGQHTAFQQNAQLPAADMSVLEGISPERLAAIAHLFQSGALQMPPPPLPQLSAATQHTITAAQAQSTGSEVPVQISSASAPQDVDMETEEGEVDETEETYTPPNAREFLRPPPTGPKNRSISPRGPLPIPKQNTSKPQRPTQSTSKNVQPAPQHGSISQATLQNGGRRLTHEEEKEETEKFLREIVRAGATYEDLAKEVSSPRALDRLLRDIKLPVRSRQPRVHPGSINGEAPELANDGMNIDKVPLTTKAPIVPPIKRPAVARPAPADRSEYLARLQAAKSEKPNAATAPAKPAAADRTDYVARLQAAKDKKPELATAPHSDPPVASATPTQNSEQNQAPTSDNTPVTKGRPFSADRMISMTELARRKLEALKASRAVKPDNNVDSSTSQPRAQTLNNGQAVSSPAQIQKQYSATGSSPSQVGLGAGLVEAAAKAVQVAVPPIQIAPQLGVQAQALVSPSSATPSRSFSGLPGLFMVGDNTPAAVPVVQQQTAAVLQPPFTNTTTASPVPATVSRNKRPVAADFDFDDVYAKPSSAKRPFGQSRTASEDEGLVIEVSEDEDDDDDEMDIEQSGMDPSKTPLQTKSFRDVGPLRDFPTRSNFQPQGSGTNTPSGVSYEQRLKEIEEMKQRIAKMEKRQKSNGDATLAPPSVSEIATGKQTTAIVENPISNEAEVDKLPQPSLTSDNTHETQEVPSEPLSTIQLTKRQEKERLRARLLELEQEQLKYTKETARPITQDSELVMSGALQDAPESAQEQQINEEAMLPAEINGGSVSEEGQLSDDDSVSKFYSCQDADDVPNDLAAAVVSNQVGSQATTASASMGYGSPHGAAQASAFGAPSTIEYGDSDSGRPATIDGGTESFAGQTSTTGRIIFGQPSAVGGSASSGTPSGQYNAFGSSAAQAASPMPSVGPELQAEFHEDRGAHETMPSATLSEPLIYDEDMEEAIDDAGAALDEQDVDDTNEDGELDVSKDSASDMDVSETPVQYNNADEEDSSRETSFEPEEYQPEPEHTSADLLVDGVGPADDDLAPELQSSGEQQAVVLDQDQDVVGPVRHFKPYKSPLMAFKDYRYDPQYLHTTSGFKSTTYSHNIDVDVQFCPFETAGGKCNDASCRFQHFEAMALSDSDLLKQLVTQNVPVKDAEDHKKWNEGISALVQQLRTANLGTDVNIIAARIAEFRRDFLGGDPPSIIHVPNF